MYFKRTHKSPTHLWTRKEDITPLRFLSHTEACLHISVPISLYIHVMCDRKHCRALCMNELYTTLSSSIILLVNDTMTCHLCFCLSGICQTSSHFKLNYYVDKRARFEILPLSASADPPLLFKVCGNIRIILSVK